MRAFCALVYPFRSTYLCWQPATARLRTSSFILVFIFHSFSPSPQTSIPPNSLQILLKSMNMKTINAFFKNWIVLGCVYGFYGLIRSSYYTRIGVRMIEEGSVKVYLTIPTWHRIRRSHFGKPGQQLPKQCRRIWLRRWSAQCVTHAPPQRWTKRQQNQSSCSEDESNIHVSCKSFHTHIHRERETLFDNSTYIQDSIMTGLVEPRPTVFRMRTDKSINTKSRKTSLARLSRLCRRQRYLCEWMDYLNNTVGLLTCVWATRGRRIHPIHPPLVAVGWCAAAPSAASMLSSCCCLVGYPSPWWPSPNACRRNHSSPQYTHRAKKAAHDNLT